MKVLHAPVNIGNHAWTLSRSERRQGVDSRLVTLAPTWLNYPSDVCLSHRQVPTAGAHARRLLFGLTAPFQFDVLHYYFGRSFWFGSSCHGFSWYPFADVRLAKALGKKVFYTLQGCDVRIASESNRRNLVTPCRADGCSLYAQCLSRRDKRRRWFIDTVLPWCNRIFFVNPELGHYLPGGVFLPYANVDVEGIELAPPRLSGKPRILHAPSDPSIKGTAIILAAIDKLRHRFEFDFSLIQNMAHAQAMEAYREADLVIDQVLAGWYGGFAVELMAMGKPVACYLRKEDLVHLPAGMNEEIPLLNVHPDRLYEDLLAIFEQRDRWQHWSARSRAYVLKWHNPRYIACAMVNAYRSPSSHFDLNSVLTEYANSRG